jgi:hypothetical protein
MHVHVCILPFLSLQNYIIYKNTLPWGELFITKNLDYLAASDHICSKENYFNPGHSWLHYVRVVHQINNEFNIIAFESHGHDHNNRITTKGRFKILSFNCYKISKSYHITDRNLPNYDKFVDKILTILRPKNYY